MNKSNLKVFMGSLVIASMVGCANSNQKMVNPNPNANPARTIPATPTTPASQAGQASTSGSGTAISPSNVSNVQYNLTSGFIQWNATGVAGTAYIINECDANGANCNALWYVGCDTSGSCQLDRNDGTPTTPESSQVATTETTGGTIFSVFICNPLPLTLDSGYSTIAIQDDTVASVETSAAGGTFGPQVVGVANSTLPGYTGFCSSASPSAK